MKLKKDYGMTELLLKIFVKNYKDITDSKVRTKYGTLGSVFGLISNFLVFLAKIVIGIFSGSISIIADAINNLSDFGNSGLTLFGYKLAAKPADKDHPYGHQRIEYIMSLIIAVIILSLGINIMIQGVSAIITPSEAYSAFPTLNVIILGIAILIKILQAFLYRSLGNRIDSMPLKATAIDSRNDVLSTVFVILGIIISYFTGFTQIDGILACVVALVIVYSGVSILTHTSDILLGEKPKEEIIESFIKILEKNPRVLGVHDIQMHMYGPNHTFASAHVEVDGREDVFVSHDMIDNLEAECLSKLKINTVLHMDPVKVNDPETDHCKKIVREALKTIDPKITFHDFRIVSGPTHTNAVFDIVIPFENKKEKRDILSELSVLVKEKDPKIIPVVTCDDEYTTFDNETEK